MQLTLFDYQALDAETRFFVQEQAAAIKRNTGEYIVDTGRRLLAVKARLEHGQFGAWLRAEFQWSDQTALNFMNVAREFGENPKVLEFARSALYLLAAPSTPDTARQEAIERAEAGEPITYSMARGLVDEHRGLTAAPISFSYADRLTRPSLPDVLEYIEHMPGAIPTIARKIDQLVREKNREERIEALKEAAFNDPPPLSSLAIRYPVLYADPPWRYEHSVSDSRMIENQYPTMPLEAICALPVAEITTPDSVLFLWATSPKLAESFQVLDAWGFTYRTCMVWVKDRIGMGYYFRQRHELLLVATRGTPPTPLPEDRPDSVLTAPRLAHSAKPLEVYDLLERMYPDLPRLELFARHVDRPGWAVWGNQVA